MSMEVQYQTHERRKKESRCMKTTDKTDARINANHYVATFDLQKVLICPAEKVGQICYKRKLAYYNLTVFDLSAKQGNCFMWNEIIARRGSCEIASCLWNMFKMLSTTIDKITLYSDSCPDKTETVS